MLRIYRARDVASFGSCPVQVIHRCPPTPKPADLLASLQLRPTGAVGRFPQQNIAVSVFADHALTAVEELPACRFVTTARPSLGQGPQVSFPRASSCDAGGRCRAQLIDPYFSKIGWK